jgi:hypothetical protein
VEGVARGPGIPGPARTGEEHFPYFRSMSRRNATSPRSPGTGEGHFPYFRPMSRHGRLADS